jgi:hypothetical protein
MFDKETAKKDIAEIRYTNFLMKNYEVKTIFSVNRDVKTVNIWKYNNFQIEYKNTLKEREK